MRIPRFSRYAFSSCVAAAILAACNGSQPPIGAPATFENALQGRGSRSSTSSAGQLERRDIDVPRYKVTGPLVFITNYDTPLYAAVTVYDAKARDPEPIARITKGLSEPGGDCVDGDGTLYVLTQQNSILEYKLGSTKVFKTITQGLFIPDFCAIDSSGNLWVTNFDGRNVTEYEKGATKPHLVIRKGLRAPGGIAIDHAGTMYVVNFTPYSHPNVQVYPLGARKPSRTITDGITWPIGIAVDSKGTLYVTNDVRPCNIEEYRRGQNHPYQAITNDINGPTDIAFAKNGWMYEVNEGAEDCTSNGPWPAILEFRPGSLKPTKRMITKDLHTPVGIAYYPPLLP